MSLKVGDEVRIVKDWYREMPRGCRDLSGRVATFLEFDDGDEFYSYKVFVDGAETYVHAIELIQPACPIARESAKLAAKVEQLEAEVNAWIERMRRGEL